MRSIRELIPIGVAVILGIVVTAILLVIVMTILYLDITATAEGILLLLKSIGVQVQEDLYWKGVLEISLGLGLLALIWTAYITIICQRR